MKAGIIGFPQVGKTTLFKILTKAHLDMMKFSGSKTESHVGVATVPDPRLDELSKIFNPKKTSHATVEYLDVAGLVKGESKDATYLGNLRNVDALVHVVRVFADESISHVEGSIDPKRDIANVELELLVSDLSIVEKRLDRLEKDIKKQKSAVLEKELELLKRCKLCLEEEKPLRGLELDSDEKKILRGFMFLSEKPILHVLNLSDGDSNKIDQIISAFQLGAISSQVNVGVTAVCGKVEAELAELSGEDAELFLADYGLKESGLDRLIRVTYQLLGLISFFTVGDDECRAWTIQQGTTALKAAGVIHSDIERCFIRAEVVPCDKLLELKSLTAARDKGLLRMEGKGYLVQDGDVINFRHSG
ncbi:MAG: redox-regulated ATPase YchF [Acidobacteria bacterium]|nr:MAG: redox-regulated ATPase YchF [Acidobacteriota bacterium]